VLDFELLTSNGCIGLFGGRCLVTGLHVTLLARASRFLFSRAIVVSSVMLLIFLPL
jgi:hypothetical protein